MVEFAVKSVRAATRAESVNLPVEVELRFHYEAAQDWAVAPAYRRVRTSSSLHRPPQLEPMGSMKRSWRPADTSDLAGGQV